METCLQGLVDVKEWLKTHEPRTPPKQRGRRKLAFTPDDPSQTSPRVLPKVPSTASKSIVIPGAEAASEPPQKKRRTGKPLPLDQRVNFHQYFMKYLTDLGVRPTEVGLQSTNGNLWCCTSLVDINLILVVPFFLFSVMCGAIFSTALNPKWFEIEELFISLPPGPNWGWFLEANSLEANHSGVAGALVSLDRGRKLSWRRQHLALNEGWKWEVIKGK